MAKRERVCRTMLVDEDESKRDALLTCYFKSIRPSIISQYDKHEIHKCVSVRQVQGMINNGVIPDLIIFSQDFPIAEFDELDEWLSSQELAITRMRVPLSGKK
ncbi:MAG: hypothetical protein ABIJ84_03975 [bacterium]